MEIRKQFLYIDFMDTIHTRIKDCREKLSLSQQELAAAVGVTYQAVQQWEKEDGTGTTPRGKRMDALAAALNTTPAYLVFGTDSGPSLRPVRLWESEEELDTTEYVFLPAMDIKLSAGSGNLIWHIDEKGQRQAFRKQWASRMGINPECAATMVVSGSSMEPRLLDGDSIVVDYNQNSAIIDGKIYAIILEGELYVKRLFKEFGGIRVVSDNPDRRQYPDKIVPADKMEYLTIIGRVVAVSGAV